MTGRVMPKAVWGNVVTHVRQLLIVGGVLMLVMGFSTRTAAQAPPQTPPAPQPSDASQVAPTGVTPPADYVIGPDAVLSIVIWREKEM